MASFPMNKQLEFLAGAIMPVAPTTANDVANKAYVDTVVAGSAFNLEAARVEADTNINIAIGGLLSIDGVNLQEGDRVLLTAQTDPIDNGVYIASSGAWSRSSDADTGTVLKSGTRIYIEEGTDHAMHEQKLAATADVTIGTDAQTWVHAFTYDLNAGTMDFDGTGNTYVVANNVSDALDQADAELVAQDARLDNVEADIGVLETAVAAIDPSGDALVVYNGRKYQATGQTIAANAWTTFSHNLNEQYPSGIEIFDIDGKRMTDSFLIDLIDANSLRIENQTATVYSDMVIIVRA